jgi:hypothetical protein
MNNIELFINNPANAKLDLQGDIPIALQYSVADIRDISKRNAAYSKTIVLPGTKNNNYWFGNLFDINSDFTSFNPNKKTTAKLLVNGELVIDGFLQLRKINKDLESDDDGELIKYECVIYNNFVDLMTELGEKTLYQLPLDEFNHVYEPISITSSWTHTWQDGYVYPMVGTHEKDYQYNLDYFFPATFYKMVFNKIINSAGFGWTGSFANNAQFEKEIISFVRDGNVFIDETEKNRRKFRASATDGATAFAGNLPNQNGSFQIGTGNVIPYNDDTTPPNFDNDNNWDVVDWEWEVDRNGTYDVNYKTSFTFSVANPTIYVAINNNGLSNPTNYGISIEARPRLQKWNGTSWVTLALGPLIGTNTSFAGQSYTLPYTISPLTSYSLFFNFPEQTFQGIQLLQGEKVRVVVRLDKVGPPNGSGYSNPVQTGGFYLAQISTGVFQPITMPITLTFNSAGNYIFNNAYTTEVVQGDTLQLGTFLPDKIKQKDLISDLIKRYNLHITIDPDNERLLVIDERPNFYLNPPIVDWTFKKDHSKMEDIQLLSELQFKEMLFTWTEDDDRYNKEYRDITGDIYGQYSYDFDNDFVKGVKEIKSPFSPTPLVKTQFGAFVAAIDPVNPKVKPRILYWGGLKDYGSNWQLNYTDFAGGGITVSSTFSQYPYAGHWDDPINPTLDIHFGTPKFLYYNEWEQIPVDSMYNVYWSDYIRQIENGRLLTAYFDLDETDIRFIKDNFNTKIFIKDSYYYVNKIIDYKPLTPQTTKVELIKIDDGIKWSGGGNAISEPITTPSCPVDVVAKLIKNEYFYVSASGQEITEECCDLLGGIWVTASGSSDSCCPIIEICDETQCYYLQTTKGSTNSWSGVYNGNFGGGPVVATFSIYWTEDGYYMSIEGEGPIGALGNSSENVCPITGLNEQEWRVLDAFVDIFGASASLRTLEGTCPGVRGFCRVRRRPVRPIGVGVLQPVEINGSGNGPGGGIYVGSGNKVVKSTITDEDGFIRENRTMIFGDYNEVDADNSIIMGGDRNIVNSSDSFILIGDENTIEGDTNFIFGGDLNNIDGGNNILMNSYGSTVSGSGITLISSSGVIATQSNLIYLGNALTVDTNEGTIFVNGITFSGGGSFSGDTLMYQSGEVVSASFSGTPLIYDVNFIGTFTSSYVVSVESEDPRDWTVSNKTSTGFRLNSNSSTSLSNNVYWTAIEEGNKTIGAFVGADGATGSTGSTGSNGLNGVDGAISDRWVIQYVNNTDPDSTGNISLNSPTFSNISVVKIRPVALSGGDWDTYFNNLVSRQANGWTLRIQLTDISNNFNFGLLTSTDGSFTAFGYQFNIATASTIFNGTASVGKTYSVSWALEAPIGATGSFDTSGTYSIKFNNGTFGTPSIAFGSDPDTGIYRVGANQLGIAAGGATSAVFTSTGIRTNKLFMTSPNGTQWEVSILNTGGLTASIVA